MHFVFFTEGACIIDKYDYPACFLVHVNVVPAQLVGQLAGDGVSVRGDHYVPIEAFFAEQEVAQRASDEVCLLVLFAEVPGCLL